MKTNHLLRICFLTCLFLSCSKSEDEPNTNKGTVIPQKIDIDAGVEYSVQGAPEGGELKIEVVSTSFWDVSISETRAAVDWITICERKQNAITLRIGEHIDKEPRSVRIRFVNEINSSTIILTQRPYTPANLSATPDRIEAEAAATTKTFVLHSDLKWELESDNNAYCTASPARGNSGDHTITVSIPENTSTESMRISHITMKAGNETATVTVSQNRKIPKLDIDRGIKSLDDMCNFRDAVNSGSDLSLWKYNGEINLLADIDLSYVENWEPIGVEENPFTGIFNGNGFTIDNLTIESSAYSIGFFGFCIGGTIKNLNITHACIKRYNPTGSANIGGTGGICGNLGTKNTTGKIVKCTIEGYVDGGAITGWSYLENGDVFVTDCSSRAIASYFAGGGDSRDRGRVKITGCKNEGVCPSAVFQNDDSKNITECEDIGYIAPVYQLYPEGSAVSRSLEEFRTYVKSIESIQLEEQNFNERFLELLTGITSLKYTNRTGRDMLDVNRFVSLKELNIYSQNSMSYELKCNNLLDLASLTCRIANLASLQIDNCRKLDHMDLQLGSDSSLSSLDISHTSINKSEKEYPLRIFSWKMETLYLKSGWLIKGINVDRSTDYISNDIEIRYKN